jgi:hypothetical protein
MGILYYIWCNGDIKPPMVRIWWNLLEKGNDYLLHYINLQSIITCLITIFRINHTFYWLKHNQNPGYLPKGFLGVLPPKSPGETHHFKPRFRGLACSSVSWQSSAASGSVSWYPAEPSRLTCRVMGLLGQHRGCYRRLYPGFTNKK